MKVLSRLFRGKFLAFLRKAQRKGKLHFHGALAAFQRGPGFEGLLNQAYDCEWVVYTKAPFGGPEQVLRYLSRYTHRVAISNRRILSMADGNVTFRWKDYAHGSKHKVSTLAACEFLRRFFLHVLPRGFVRIRHFGFLANRQRKVLLEICRSRLPQASLVFAGIDTGAGLALLVCPVCHRGHLQVIERMSGPLVRFAFVDSS